MQRIDGLIQKLATQRHQKISNAQLLLTLTDLQKALLEEMTQAVVPLTPPVEASNGTSHEVLSVAQQSIEVAQHKHEEPKLVFPLQDIPPVVERINIPLPLVVETPTVAQVKVSPIANTNSSNQKELNELLAKEDNSVNKRLHTNQPELADKLQDTPIADLKQAFSINEKFVILQELFNNDETSFDKSIRTLNNFATATEANLWMEREFFTMLGWNKQNPFVIDFLETVYRRYL
jgi:hypothetical protein